MSVFKNYLSHMEYCALKAVVLDLLDLLKKVMSTGSTQLC